MHARRATLSHAPSRRSRQRGWAGLVALLIVLLIVGFLAKDAIVKYGLSGSTVVGAPGKGAPATSAPGAPPGSAASIQSGTPIQRARAADAFVQTQSEENKRRIDDAAK
jgi:hypothetical protein